MKRIAVVSGLDYGDIRSLESHSIGALADALHWMAVKPEPELAREIEIGWRKYRLVTDASKLEVGCFIDLESLIEEGAEDHLHTILSLLYREADSPGYKGIDDELASKFLELPCTVALGASRFFFLLAQAFTRITRTSLEIRERMLGTMTP